MGDSEISWHAVRLGVLLVDPWGPSRLRRWLHVRGACGRARPPGHGGAGAPAIVPAATTDEIPADAAV